MDFVSILECSPNKVKGQKSGCLLFMASSRILNETATNKIASEIKVNVIYVNGEVLEQ